jgi:hypothetical protein
MKTKDVVEAIYGGYEFAMDSCLKEVITQYLPIDDEAEVSPTRVASLIEAVAGLRLVITGKLK